MQGHGGATPSTPPDRQEVWVLQLASAQHLTPAKRHPALEESDPGLVLISAEAPHLEA